MKDHDGLLGEREVMEVELMLEEDELARCCYYCGRPENDWDGDERFKHLGGEGYEATHRCPTVSTLVSLLPRKS